MIPVALSLLINVVLGHAFTPYVLDLVLYFQTFRYFPTIMEIGLKRYAKTRVKRSIFLDAEMNDCRALPVSSEQKT